MAVATLSIFLVPMTSDLGLSRGLFSSAVSLGGVCAVAVSPVVGWWIDRRGAGTMVALGGALVGFCAIGLAFVTHSWAFLLIYLVGRMSFASPLELGTSTAVSNWFIRRRPLALGLLNGSQGTGLALMPFIAHLIIVGWDWRVAWASLGLYTLMVAVVPALLLIRRRPEDMGLEPDPPPRPEEGPAHSTAQPGEPDTMPLVERSFTLRQASVTRAFWVLALFSGAGYMVQAGVSLHQAPHYISQGLSGSAAAVTVSIFAISQVPGGLFWSALARRVPVRFLLAFTGFTVAAGGRGLRGKLDAAGRRRGGVRVGSRRGRPARAAEAGVGRLLWPSPPGLDPGSDVARADRWSGRGSRRRGVHVRFHPELREGFHHLHLRRVSRGAHGTDRNTAIPTHGALADTW